MAGRPFLVCKSPQTPIQESGQSKAVGADGPRGPLAAFNGLVRPPTTRARQNCQRQNRRAMTQGRDGEHLDWQAAERPVFAQAAQKGPDARRRHPSDGYPVPIRRMGVGARRTLSVRRSAARVRGYPPKVGLRRWAFLSNLLGEASRD